MEFPVSLYAHVILKLLLECGAILLERTLANNLITLSTFILTIIILSRPVVFNLFNLQHCDVPLN